MKKTAKKKKPISPYESVKLNRTIVDRVRARKQLTGVSIIRYIEMAVEEKLTIDLKDDLYLSDV